MTFTEWVNHYECNILPLREDADNDCGEYHEFDDAYNTHLEELHEMIRERSSLLDAAPEMLAMLERVTEWMREHTGPSDGTHDLLTNAVALIQTAGGTIR